MKCVLRSMFAGVLMVVVLGCDDVGRKEPLLEGVKIGDLSPSGGGGQGDNRIIQTVNLDLLAYEIPAEQMEMLGEVYAMLNTKALRLNNPTAFTINGFRGGAGSISTLALVNNALEGAGGRRLPSTSLLLPHGATDMFSVLRLTKRQRITWLAPDASVEGAEAGPGRLGVEVRARKIEGERPSTYVVGHPFYTPTLEGLPEKLRERMEAQQLRLRTLGFGLQMTIGDFVLLAPAQYVSRRDVLSGLFFSRAGGTPTVRVYILACSDIY
jgi:hypothetical protein